MNNAAGRQDTMFATRLLGRRMQAGFAFLLAYGGGLWMQLLHEAEGGVEPGAPPGIVHWLRDSTLALPLIVVAVFVGAALSRRLVDRFGGRSADLVVGLVVAVVLAFHASLVLAVGNPIHGLLFPATHVSGHDLPVGLHIVRDCLLALSVNELLALSLVCAFVARRWLLTRRRWSTAAAT
jgi:hypothetical protein